MIVYFDTPLNIHFLKTTFWFNYGSPSSGEAHKDRQLTTNSEFWVEIFCVPTCFHMRILKQCLYVHLSIPWENKSLWLHQYQSYISNWYINGKIFKSTTPWEPKNLNFFQKSLKFEFLLVTKRWNHLSFVNISRTLVANWYINGKVFTSTTPWKPKNLNFISKKFEFGLVTKSWNHLSFINISPTMVIDTSMERSLRVLATAWKPQNLNFYQKISKLNFDLCWRAEITLASSISVLQW